MGTIYKETYTKPLPANVEVFTRKGAQFAPSKDAKGRTRTARVAGRDVPRHQAPGGRRACPPEPAGRRGTTPC